MKNGLLVVLSGPSGAGKGTVIEKLLENSGLRLSVSCTTRKPRAGELEGVNYFFKSKKEFENMIDNNEFLEYQKVFDNYYGTPADYVYRMLVSGQDVLLEIDVQGAETVREKFGEAVFIFLAPPSLGELERRIRTRGTETDEEIEKRLSVARDELNYISEYDYIIINEDINNVVKSIKSILIAEKQKVFRNEGIKNAIVKGGEIND